MATVNPNPLYFGYYPGDPMYRPPRYFYKRPIPGEPIDFGDDFDEFLEQAAEDLNVPKWVKDNLVKDFNGSLRAVIKPGGVSAAQLESYGEEATEDMVGAFGISISLDPRDWRHPVEQAGKTLRGWFEAAADFDDFSSRQRRDYWKKILSPAGEYSTSALERSAIRSESERAMPDEPTYYNNPLDLDIYDANGEFAVPSTFTDLAGNEVKGNMYAKVRDDVMEFNLFSRTVTQREGRYDSMLLNSAKALKKDLEVQGATSSGITRDWSISVDPHRTEEIEKAVKSFSAKTDLIDSITKFESNLRKGIQGNIQGALTTQNYKITKNRHGEDKSFLRISTVKDEDGNNIDLNLNELMEYRIKTARDKMSKALAGLSAKEQAQLKRILAPYEKKLDQLQNLTKQGGALHKVSQSDFTTAVKNPLERQRLLAEIETKIGDISSGGIRGIGITGGDFLAQSTSRKLLRQLEREILDDKEGIFKHTYGGERIKAIFRRLEDERNYASVTEFIRAVENKSLLRTYIWSRFRKKFYYLTPAYWTEQALSKVHHFGLVVNQNAVDDVYGKGATLNLGFGRGKISENSTLGRLFSNNFRLNIKGQNKVVKIHGGSHFKVIGSLESHLTSKKLNDNGLKFLMSIKEGDLRLIGSHPGSPLFHTAYNEFIKKNGGALKLNEDGFRNLLLETADFKHWVRKNKGVFGRNAADNPEFLKDLVNSLHIRNINASAIDITRRFSGVLEKVAQSINLAQSSIVNSLTGGRVKNFNVFHARRLVSNAIEKVKRRIIKVIVKIIKKVVKQVIDKAILIILGGTTGGVGAAVWKVIGPIVTKIIAFTLVKMWDFTKGVLKGILKGDFSDLGKFFRESFEDVLKIFTYCASCFAIAFLLVMGVFGAVLSGTGPVDTAPIGTGEFGAGGDLPPGNGGGGGGGYVDPCFESSITPSSCVFDEGHTRWGLSYNPSGETTDPYAGGSGHGSNSYWNNLAGADCRYDIPIQSLIGTTSKGPTTGGENNMCFSQDGRKPFYGAAMDVAPNGCRTVYLPGVVVRGGLTVNIDEWEIGPVFSSATGGSGVIITGEGDDDCTYKMTVLHIAGSTVVDSSPLSSGSRLAELYDWGANSHVHLESKALGAICGPEDVYPPEELGICN